MTRVHNTYFVEEMFCAKAFKNLDTNLTNMFARLT